MLVKPNLNTKRAKQIMKSNHTPGPWKANHITRSITDKRGCRIATIEEMPGQDESEQEANGRLAEASPDLLEALAGVVEWFDDNFAEEKYMNDDEQWISYSELPVWKAAFDAISKAKGKA